MENIKKEMVQRKKQSFKLLEESYHSTSSNNDKGKVYQIKLITV